MPEYTITQLADNNVDDTRVQTSQSNAVWSASDGNDDEIYLYDGDSTSQPTDFKNIFAKQRFLYEKTYTVNSGC